MKPTKYNSWEDLKETFAAELVFQCESEMFLMVDVHTFRVDNSGDFVTVDNTRYPNGIIISVVQNHTCNQYCYREVDFV